MKIVVSPLKALADLSQFKCGAKFWINKIENSGIRTKANYIYNDFKGLTPKCCGKCCYVVKGKLNVSFVLVICKMLLIWSFPLRGPFILAFFLFINVIFIFVNTSPGVSSVTQKGLTLSPVISMLLKF